MLKSIATARSEWTAKQESKASYNTHYIIPDLIDFFGDDWKEIKMLTEKKLSKILYRLKISLFLAISENFLKTIRKNNVLTICISY